MSIFLHPVTTLTPLFNVPEWIITYCPPLMITFYHELRKYVKRTLHSYYFYDIIQTMRVDRTKVLDRTKLIERMNRAGIESFTELADRIGMSRISVSQWVNGHSQPGYESLCRLAREFGLKTVEPLLKEIG